jgi:hypothetical protein
MQSNSLEKIDKSMKKTIIEDNINENLFKQTSIFFEDFTLTSSEIKEEKSITEIVIPILQDF